MKPSIATTHTLHIPATLKFHVTPEQFATLATHNRYTSNAPPPEG